MKMKLVLLMALSTLVFECYSESISHNGTIVSMDFVEIGYAGNNAQSAANRAHTYSGGDGYGGVDYVYRIGKYEVTEAQWQAVRSADPNVGNSGYRSGLQPTSGTTWLEAAKFANWLTSGSYNNGAYRFSDPSTLIAVDRAGAASTYGTIYVLPSEDEWYKAAYLKSDGSGYTHYSTGDSAPVSGVGGQNYNSSINNTWAVGSGVVENNGTYEMNGNVWEICESAYDGYLNFLGEDRVYRGGAYSESSGLPGVTRRSIYTTEAYADIGFRVVKISASSPEIGVLGPTGSLPDGGVVDFGNQAIGADKNLIFTIINEDIGILSGLSISKSGGNAPVFTIGELERTSLGSGGHVSFRVTFTPLSTGSHTAQIHIASNDLDENPFDITLTGNGLANTDSDLGSDAWETANGFSPTVDGDVASLDSDGDGSPDILEIYQGTERYLAGSAASFNTIASIESSSDIVGNGFSNVSTSNGALIVNYRRSTTQTAVNAKGIWASSLGSNNWKYSGESASGSVVTVTETVISSGVDFEIVEALSEPVSGGGDTLFFRLELTPNE